MNTLYGDRYEAYSAGTEPTEVSPYAVAVMKELGIDISSQRPKSVKSFLGETFDYVITICDQAKEACPFFPGAKQRMHRGFEDPEHVQGTKTETFARFRRIRDEISMWLAETFGAIGKD